MRGVECTQPEREHLHADNDDALTQAVVRHFGDAHSDVAFGADAARRLVDGQAYEDTEHASKLRGGWANFAGNVGGGGGSG